MSDGDRPVVEPDFGNEGPVEREVGGPPKRRRSRSTGGFLSGVLLQVLKWLIIVIVTVVLIVTVVIVTVNRLSDRGGTLRDAAPLGAEYSAQPPIFEWYSDIEEIRGSTADDVTQTFIVVVHIGYDTMDRAIQSELIARKIQIRELISFYFGSKLAEDLRGVENRQRVKSDLTRQINRIMLNGKIRDVAFDQYQILSF